MIGMFGGLIFRVSFDRQLTIADLTMDSGARWADHEVIGRKPKKEFLGPGARSLTFAMELSAERGVNPTATAEKLYQYMDDGISSLFILGGRSLGRYVIESMSASYDIITNQGGVVAMKLDVTLGEY